MLKRGWIQPIPTLYTDKTDGIRHFGFFCDEYRSPMQVNSGFFMFVRFILIMPLYLLINKTKKTE